MKNQIPNKINWDEMPKGLLGWIFWSLPRHQYMVIIWKALLCGMACFIGATAILGFWQLWMVRGSQIEKFG